MIRLARYKPPIVGGVIFLKSLLAPIPLFSSFSLSAPIHSGLIFCPTSLRAATTKAGDRAVRTMGGPAEIPQSRFVQIVGLHPGRPR